MNTTTTKKTTRKRTLKTFQNKEPMVEYASSPQANLRELVRQHVATTKAKVSVVLRTTDKELADGTISPCLLPPDLREAIRSEQLPVYDKALDNIEKRMVSALKHVPIYQHFLSKVYGVGTIAAAYLIAFVDINRCMKVSQLQRYAGLAVIDGRLERMQAKEVRKYNPALRTKLYTAMNSMWRNAAKKTAAAPLGSTTKYLDIWRGKKQGFESTGRKGGHSAGWHVAGRVLLEDLYIVWRTLEGLDVWPSYHAAQMGFYHGGKVCVNGGKKLTLDEALSIVGDTGAKPASTPAEDLQVDPLVENEMEAL